MTHQHLVEFHQGKMNSDTAMMKMKYFKDLMYHDLFRFLRSHLEEQVSWKSVETICDYCLVYRILKIAVSV